MAAERDMVYLAALLHDIGKFWQRADPSGVKSSKILSESIKDLESTLCPLDFKYKTRSHKHVLWTAQFFQENGTQFSKMMELDNSEIMPDSLMKISAAHHSPDQNDWLQLLIQKADHYSSGEDRSKEDSIGWKDAEEEEDKKWESFRRIKMRSIFEGIDPDNAENEGFEPKYLHKLPTEAIVLEQTFFPKKEDDTLPDYATLWRNFLNETKFIQAKSFKVFAETMLFLLEKYTSRIPSSTIHLPDVSLYDHSKTVAAFAVALYDYLKHKKAQKMPNSNEKPFALVGGDLSGIQKFIYGIIARGAAKNLKGRSFYLQLLVDNIVRKILDSLSLYDANIIYASGGGFYILAPNVGDLDKRLRELESQIAQRLFEFHGTDLYLALDFVPFGEAELYNEKGKDRTIGHIWKEVSEKLGAKKGQRFKVQLENGYTDFFTPKNEGGNKSGRDAITGEDLLVYPKPVKLEKDGDDNVKVNAYTYQQIELGRKLKSTQYWIQSTQKLCYLEEEGFEPAGLGYLNYFVDKQVFDKYDEEFRKFADSVRVVFFNKGNFLEPIQKGIDNVYGFTFYGGNDYPASKWPETPKTFEEIAGIEFDDEKKDKRASAPNLVRMGVLRMDVDRLGSTFQKGFAPAKRTFSRYSTLSRSLDYFFKGYLNHIWAENADYKASTQIIYSGGDDLFIVGKWDVLAKMAVDINRNFRDWVCQSPKFTLSGGMAMVGPKYPLLKAALLSEAFEKEAKNHEFGEEKKNAFSVFGYSFVQNARVQDLLFAFNWDKELPYVLKLKDRIAGLLDKGLSQGFPSDAYNLMQQADFELRDGRYQIQNFSVIWMAAYNFKRAIQSNAQDKEHINAFLGEWSSNLMTHRIKDVPDLVNSKFHPLQFLALAARWAALEKRTKI